MPLDLSPCDVGVPSCQPTFDLTKKQFMPQKNGKHVRGLVKTRQEKIVDDAFNGTLGVSIAKWKPLLVCHKHRGKVENSANSGRSIFQSIENWWHWRSTEVQDTESDELSYFYDQGETTQVRRANDIVLDTVGPFECPQPAVTAADRELIVSNEEKVYQQYYSHPMAPEYLSLSHSPNRDDKVSPFHWQQNRVNRPASAYIDWTNPCMACRIAQSN